MDSQRNQLKAIVASFITFMAVLPSQAIAQQGLSGSSEKFYQFAMQYSAQHRGVSMLVLKNGEVVFEQYSNGGAPEKYYELASGTKSFSGIAAVALQEDGILDLDEKVSNTITEWKNDPVRSKITISQLLHLTAGVQGGPGRPPTYEQAVYTEIAGEPGTKFKYGPGSFQIFGELVFRKLKEKETLNEYLDRRIFKPIGMKVSNWRVGSDGMPLLPQGAKLTANDWAKFGEFVLNKGKVNGKQILKEESIAQCFRGTSANPMYGLTWWLNRPIDDDLRSTITPLTTASDIEYGAEGIPGDLVMAAGAGGQRLYIIPSKNMVIVRQADRIMASLFSGRKNKFSDQDFLSRVFLGKPKTSSINSHQPESRNSSKRRQRFQRIMSRFDSNGDGQLDRQEKLQLMQFIKERRANR